MKELEILSDVLAISVKNAPVDSKRTICNAVVEVIPKFPNVGQNIPDTWMWLWKLLGAVRQYGADADESELFRETRSQNARTVGSTDDMTVTARGAYCRKEKLRGAGKLRRRGWSRVQNSTGMDS